MQNQQAVRKETGTSGHEALCATVMYPRVILCATGMYPRAYPALRKAENRLPRKLGPQA